MVEGEKREKREEKISVALWLASLVKLVSPRLSGEPSYTVAYGRAECLLNVTCIRSFTLCDKSLALWAILIPGGKQSFQ